MKSREEALIDVEELGIVVFRALNTKRQQPVVVTPLEDMTGRLWTGQGKTGYYEDLTPADKQKLSVVFDSSSKYRVIDGKPLKIKDNDFDRAQWEWIKKHPYIAMSKEEAKANPDAVFYVDNPQVQAETFVSKDKRITLVKTEVYNANAEKKKIVAKALGLFGAEALTESQIEEWLVIKVEENPDMVSSLINPKNAAFAKAMVIVKEMITYGIIKRFNTVYKYGGSEGITLGNTEESVAEWISDSNNEDTVLAMQIEIDERKGS